MTGVATSFKSDLRVLMEKHDHSIEDVAQLANTCAFVVREWYYGHAVPNARVRRDVLNALDNPDTVRNTARGWQGHMPSAFAS